MNIGALGHLFALVAFTLLTTLLAVSWRNRHIAKLLILASALTMVWAGVSLAATLTAIPPPLLQLAELGRDIGWCLFLLRILERRAADSDGDPRRFSRWRRLLLPLAAGAGALFLARLLVPELTLPKLLVSDAPLLTWLVLAITGLLLVEQIYRNGNRDERWAVKHLCLGLGALFAYDFFMFSEALLFKQVNPNLWNARGFIDALVVPLIAISAARNESWSSGIHVSRHVVFHSLTLLAAGIYLLVMASAGFFIRYYGGTWGGVLQVAFLVGTGLLLVVLLFSDTLRAKLRVLLSKHFFSYKYDYREEWSRFTRTLSRGDESIPERAIRAVSALVDSNGGLLWLKTGEQRYELSGAWGMEPPENPGTLSGEDPLVRFLEKSGWIVDLDEYQESPSLYAELDLPTWPLDLPDAWLIVPLRFDDSLLGFLLIRHSLAQKRINWEDRDLLKMAGQQAAAHLAQHQADLALMQARQFEAFNRLSAYIVHDLKNILAQQSLIVSNAEKHKHNPAFVDDVIATIENSVQRMTRLMEQMRSGMRGSKPRLLNLETLLRQVIERRSGQRPVPHLEVKDGGLGVEADKEQLSTVFGHIIQNAQEATADDGRIEVRLFRRDTQAIIEIEDSGSGMDADFISERLFKPFDSTKGLTGMGIGVFESREYIRSLGGEIQVESTPGEGSLFRILLPCYACDQEDSTSPEPEE